MRRLLAFFLTFAAIFPSASTVAAQGSGEEGETAEYRSILAEALAEYDRRNYAEARAMFTRAHEAYPNARTLRGIGMASFELRDYVDCIRQLERALAHEVRPLSDEQRTQVRDLIDRARTFVGRFAITVEPAGAVLTVDGDEIPPDARGAVLLDLGRHTFEVSCDGCSPTTETIEVRGGEDRALSLSAPTTGTTGATGSVAGPAREPDPGAGPAPVVDDGGGVSTTAIVLLTGAGVLAGTAAGMAIWWSGRGDQLAVCEGAGAACTNEGALRSEHDAAMAATLVTGGLALALGTAGLVILLTSGDDSGGSAQVSCGPGGLGVSCAGRF